MMGLTALAGIAGLAVPSHMAASQTDIGGPAFIPSLIVAFIGAAIAISLTSRKLFVPGWNRLNS